MDKEEYYRRIEKINNRFKTDRVSVDEGHQLVCQRNYLSTKYIANLEQQVKKQKEVIDELKGYLKLNIELIKEQPSNDELTDNFILSRFKSLKDILNEVSE